MVYTYEYDTVYHGPAMPVVEIEVGAADADQSNVLLRALVDSGADATMIPVRYLQQLGAKVVDRRRLRSSTDVSYPVDIYAVALTVGPFTQATLEVIGNRQSDDIIVGRDVLNHMIVTLNGLAHVVQLSY